ncbi:hypothetical protein [Desulfobacter postgatei]|nr:hypothetical protein [Desulfobacter postgatei]MDX9964702.1 hypothetical protein [Desulfobacter postgatei]
MIYTKSRFQSWKHKVINAPTVPADARPTGHPCCPQKGQTENVA